MKTEKQLKYPVCQNGFRSKTINIRTQAGETKFPLQQVNELGLPHDAQILAIWARDYDENFTASNGLGLVSQDMQANAYISLKDRANKFNEIDLLVSEYAYNKLPQRALFMQPVPSKLIDWNQSFIQINPRVTALSNEVFEIIVVYTDPSEVELWPNRFIFRDGLELSGKRTASFEIELNATQTIYSLSNSDNIGLPTDGIILGFDTVNNETPLFGQSGINPDALKSTYFTLKRGTDAFIDQFPASLDKPDLLINDLDYFPIKPIKVIDIDWQQSRIEITDNSLITDGMVFQFTLHWWSPNC